MDKNYELLIVNVRELILLLRTHRLTYHTIRHYHRGQTD